MIMLTQSFQKVHAGQDIDCRVFIKEKIIFLQIDSHTQFEKDWDLILINQLNSIKGLSDDAYFSKPIITSYPRGFEVINLENEEFKLDSIDDLVYSIAYRKDSMFMRDLFSRQIGRPLKTKSASTRISTGSRMSFYRWVFCERSAL